MIPIVMIIAATVLFFGAERILPGRELPEAPGWYVRAAFLNLVQVSIVLIAGVAWNKWLQDWSLFRIAGTMPPVCEGLLGWFIGTFVFYWWHRARHKSNLLWRVFHQVHHSPSRIEVLTAFYKHPLEIAADSILSSAILFSLLGASPEAGAWFNVFAVIGEYFYHSNLLHRAGSVTFCSVPSITPFITSSMCMISTMVTSRGGTGCLGRFGKPPISLRSADFQRTMKSTWAEC